MAQNVTIDMATVNAAYQQALPGHLEKANADAASKAHLAPQFAALGMIPSAGTVSTIAKTVCADWSEIDSAMAEALKFFSWFEPGPGAKATAGLTALNALMKQICQNAPKP